MANSKKEKAKLEDEFAKRLAYLFLVQVGAIKGAEADVILRSDIERDKEYKNIK
jgi:hypothetical protein